MIEPSVQDYIEAAMKLDRDAFCKQVGVPVLVTTTPGADPAFQSDPTRMLTGQEHRATLDQTMVLDRKASVLEIRSAEPRPEGQVNLGRSEDNDLVLQEDTVSAQHAVFKPIPREDRFWLQDLESTNGTRINDRRAEPGQPIRLRNGDTVSFGEAFFLFFHPAGFYDALRSCFSDH